MHERILLLLFGDLGDTLLTVPAVRALRERYPDSRLVVLTKALPGQILSDLSLVDDVIVVDKHLFDQPRAIVSPLNWVALFRLAAKLRRERFQTAVLFHHLVTRWGALKFGLLCLASGARERVGIDNSRGWFLTRSIPDRGFGAQHEAEYFLQVAGLLDAAGDLRLEAPVSAMDREVAWRLLTSHGLSERRFIAVHPGTGWYGPGRQWSAVSFARAVQLIQSQHDLDCVIVGAEGDREAGEDVGRLLGDRAVSLVGQTSVGQLGAVLEAAELALANDGGVAHLAAAVGTPPVTIFGPSNDRAWRPLLGTVIAADIPCRPCFYRDYERGLRFGCETRECMALVPPSAVADAATRILSEQQVAV